MFLGQYDRVSQGIKIFGYGILEILCYSPKTGNRKWVHRKRRRSNGLIVDDNHVSACCLTLPGIRLCGLARELKG